MVEIFKYISDFKNPILWKGITIHHSQTSDGYSKDWEAIRKYHLSRGWNDIGYHAGIELVEGKYIYQIGRPLDMVGAHEPKVNRDCIGICVVGNFDYSPPNGVQLWLLSALCRAYMARFGVTLDNINFHRDYSLKTCPGRMFDKLQLRDMIAGNKYDLPSVCNA